MKQEGTHERRDTRRNERMNGAAFYIRICVCTHSQHHLCTRGGESKRTPPFRFVHLPFRETHFQLADTPN